MIEVPLNNSPEQVITITIGEVVYELRVISNFRRNAWTISFSQGGVSLLNGVSLFSGVDILAQHNLPIKNMYAVNLENDNLDPDLNTLGGAARLLILTDDEVASVQAV